VLTRRGLLLAPDALEALEALSDEASDALREALEGTSAHHVLEALEVEKRKFFDGDVDQVLLPGLRTKIDALVAGWSREQKDKCLAETANSFKGGGAMMQHISPPKE
jgi:hypothetical protein